MGYIFAVSVALLAVVIRPVIGEGMGQSNGQSVANVQGTYVIVDVQVGNDRVHACGSVFWHGSGFGTGEQGV